MWCYSSVIASSMKDEHIRPLGVYSCYNKSHPCQNKAGAIFIIFIVVAGGFTIDFSGLWQSASASVFGLSYCIEFLRSCEHNCLAFVNIPCMVRETFYGCCVVAQIYRRLNCSGQRQTIIQVYAREKHKTSRGL